REGGTLVSPPPPPRRSPLSCPSCLLARSRSFCLLRAERQLLHPPVEELGHVNLVLRRARYFVDPAELLHRVARLAEPAEDLAVERQLVDTSGIRVGAVQELCARRVGRRDADGPRRARCHGRRSGRRVGGHDLREVWLLG